MKKHMFISAVFAAFLVFFGTDISASSYKKSGSKILVAYYSDTGNTEAVAKKIADYLGADLLKIKPRNPYTISDLSYSNKSSRVAKEHDLIFGTKKNDRATAEDMKRVDTRVDFTSVVSMAGYETVFIGYPVWYGMAAWPVNGFVKQNNLIGKTVVPFCTSVSSGIGNSDKVLRDIAGLKGKWLPGKRFGTWSGEQDVKPWIDSLGITK